MYALSRSALWCAASRARERASVRESGQQHELAKRSKDHTIAAFGMRQVQSVESERARECV
jgi:hypothetical protein